MAPTKGHPVSRLYFPPVMTIAKETSVARQRIVANDAMKPTVRHMEQKYRPSSSQNSAEGKNRQDGSSRLEQLLCKPMCFSYLSPLAVVTE